MTGEQKPCPACNIPDRSYREGYQMGDRHGYDDGYNHGIKDGRDETKAELVPLRRLREALGKMYSRNTMIVPSCLDDPVWVEFVEAWNACDKAQPAASDDRLAKLEALREAAEYVRERHQTDPDREVAEVPFGPMSMLMDALAAIETKEAAK